MANEREIRRWNDPRWTTAWPAREMLTSSVTPALLAALSLEAGQRVLDVGCGGGGLAIAIAGQVEPDGQVVGVDVSADLLGLARQRAAEATAGNLEFVQLDMQSGALDRSPFDLVVSQFGVMFFDEPVAAFANIGRHLQPGGALAFACWQTVDRNPWHFGTAIADLVPAPVPPAAGKSAVGPFTLGEAEHTSRLLAEAGFVGISFDSRDAVVIAPGSAVIDRSLLEFMGVATEDLPAANERVDRHLSQFRIGPDSHELPISFHIVTARKP